MLRHQLRELLCKRELVSDHLFGMDCDSPGVDRPRRVARRRDRGYRRDRESSAVSPSLRPAWSPNAARYMIRSAMSAISAGIDKHAEHQSLVHYGKHLPPLTDKSEPLGPLRDESRLRSVHRAVGSSLGLPGCLAGSGASGSFFASWTCFVIGFAAPSAGLSTDFFCRRRTDPGRDCRLLDLAAARPGLSADLI